MAFTVRAQVSPEAEATARTQYSNDLDAQIATVTRAIFDNEVQEVLRDFNWQAEGILNRAELEAIDMATAGMARSNQMKLALAALEKIKAAA